LTAIYHSDITLIDVRMADTAQAGEIPMNAPNVLVEELPATTVEPTALAGRGRLREAWHRIRRTVAEMNYATRRLTEVQAPWIVDPRWDRR
jgi:rhodanese-related sulfurtransferase